MLSVVNIKIQSTVSLNWISIFHIFFCKWHCQPAWQWQARHRVHTGFHWPLFQFLWFILFSQILESVDSLCEVTLGNPLDWKISVIFILRYIISFHGHFSTENIITALLKSHYILYLASFSAMYLVKYLWTRVWMIHC